MREKQAAEARKAAEALFDGKVMPEGLDRETTVLAGLALCDILCERLPSDAESINQRLLNPSGTQPKWIGKKTSKKEKALILANADRQMAEIMAGKSGETLGAFGNAFKALIDITPLADKAALSMVVSDYAWRKYCVQFHISDEDKGKFPSGSPLMAYEHVSRLYEKAKFDIPARLVDFKKTLAKTMVAPWDDKDEYSDFRRAVIEGISCMYLYLAEVEMKNPVTGREEPNPMAVFFGMDPWKDAAEEMARSVTGLDGGGGISGRLAARRLPGKTDASPPKPVNPR